MFWYLTAFAVIMVNLLNLIWATQIKFNRTINRRRTWKRWLGKFYFILLCPLGFFMFIFRVPYNPLVLALVGLTGVWFGISQIRFIKKHAGVPQLVEPLSSLYFLISSLLFVLALAKFV